jgi:uroporphyrinogen-III synthase
MSGSSLAGKRVLIPRAEGQAEEAAELLRQRGAEPVVIPTVSVEPIPLTAAVDGFDWVIFTSANGVAFSFQGRGRGAFGQARFAVVGTATEKALAREGATAAIVAKEFRGEGLAKALLESGETIHRALLLRAEEASEVLPEALREAGIEVVVVAVYRTRPLLEAGAEVARRLRAGDLDAVIFSSGSTVRAVCDPMGEDAKQLLARVTVACIGPVTAKAAEERAIRVDVLPPVATFAATILALEEHAEKPRAI